MSSSSLQDPHFRSANPALLQIWDDLQRWQTDFCIAQEWPLYYQSESWHTASDILDAGCGNGYYLSLVSQRFPEKQYVGADASRELIEIASREFATPTTRFHCADLFEVEEQYDAVILRLVLQHLPDADAALERLKSLVRVGGSLFVIDACDPARLFYPPADDYLRFFEAFRSHERSHGRNRDAAVDLASCIDHATWRIQQQISLLIPSTVGNNLNLFRRTYGRVIDMVKEAGEMQYDFDSVRRAWREWGERSNAYSQVGLSLIQLDRIA